MPEYLSFGELALIPLAVIALYAVTCFFVAMLNASWIAEQLAKWTERRAERRRRQIQIEWNPRAMAMRGEFEKKTHARVVGFPRSAHGDLPRRATGR